MASSLQPHASPAEQFHFSTVRNRNMKIIGALTYSVYILMPISIAMAFLLAPSAETLGEYSRIVYFHVPLAWVATLAFTVSGVLSILHLAVRKWKSLGFDELASNSASVGLAFTILAVISGSLWARLTWGSYWNWDPRQTSIVFILLIYIAYFCLRGALGSTQSKVGSSYLVVAMLTLPFFIFLAPRITDSLHPDAIININRKINMEKPMLVTLVTALVSFTMLYGFLMRLMNRLGTAKKSIEEHFHGND